jgi:hypothetical protein
MHRSIPSAVRQGLPTAVCLALLALPATLSAQRPAKKAPTPRYTFRNEFASGPLSGFQVQPREFPPEASAHAIGGELIAVDRANRTGVLRLDRTDAQARGNWDLPLPFAMLPYGSVWYHGAPAELRDIPLGTHLVGQFYWDEERARAPKTKQLIAERKLPPDDAGYHWVLRLEDDFSFFARQRRLWRIDAIDTEKKTITVSPCDAGGKPDGKPAVFQVSEATRIWKGKGIGDLKDLQAGALLLLNTTFRTMRLDGRCTDVWLDAESRSIATAQQMAIHRQYQRERGLAGWVDRVDDKARTLTVTLFEGFDPQLKKDFAQKALFREKLVDPFVAVAVAEDSLRAYDPINDVKRGPILETKEVPALPGSSGWQITVQPEVMLEGFRPGRIVRLFAGAWGVTDLPRDEKLFP